MSIREVSSQRGKILLIVEQHKFNQSSKKLTSGEIKWVCVNRKCNAYFRTIGDSGGRVITEKVLTHNHPAIEENIIQRHIVSASAKRKAFDDICEKPSKVIRKCFESNLNELKMNDLNCIKKTIYYEKRKKFPKLPSNAEEVFEVLNNINTRTLQDENFVLINDVGLNLIVFCTETNLKFLCECTTLYMDGTFSYCTKYFLQLFTIHGLRNGHYIPLVFCLLRDKKEDTYKKLFRKLIDTCKDKNWNLLPEQIVIDFEIGIHNATRLIWSEARLIGCRFHLSQAWWRKIQNLGLSSEYKNKESDIGKWLRYCFGIMFLDPDLVSDFFVFELMEEKPNDERLCAFADYLVENYISEEARFPPNIWAEASASIHRTTNACESFHSHLNSSFYNAHPSLFVFVEVLLRIQEETYIKCRSVDNTKIVRNATRKKHDFLKKTIDNFKNKKISTFTFVKTVSWYNSINNM